MDWNPGPSNHNLTLRSVWALLLAVERGCGDARCRTLLALGLTCKAFWEIALSALWKEQTSILPLLKCFPRHLWQINPRNPDNSFTFCGFISHYDWYRFEYYASNIRTLDVGWEVEAHDLAKLMSYGEQLARSFSNLQVLRWNRPNCIEFVIGILNHKLKRLEINCGEDSLCEISGFGDLVRYKTTELEELCISGCPHPATRYSMTSSLYRIEGLKSLTCHFPVLMSDVFHLSGLLNLSYVDLNLSELEDGQVMPHGMVYGMQLVFPALRHLRISGKDVEHCNVLLRLLGEHSLVSLHLDARKPSGVKEAVDIETTLSCLQNCNNPGSFTELVISVHDPEHHDRNDYDYTLDMHVIRQNLFKFRNMVQLSFDTIGTLNGTDDELEELAMSFPNIRYLKLGRWPCFEYTCFTLPGLGAFTRHCFHLEDLWIAVRAKTADIHERFNDNRELRPSWRLQNLTLGNSSIEDDREVASYISLLFPKVWFVDVEDLEKLDGDPWDRVNDLLRRGYRHG